jgi:AMP phosphorylase
MVAAGRHLSWDADVVADKHSIGGVAGNRVTPVVVPLVAAAGLTIPKTSSRAVTSAAGTADTMEVFCEVSFGISEIRSIVEETGGCMVWGGAVDISPVDDKVIRAETPLSLDPPGQVIASVLSKKKAAGSTHVVIDVPFGESAKVHSLDAARELAEDFVRVGRTIGMSVECAITRGEGPIGRGIGPVLEARDVLAVLDGGGPDDLRSKSLELTRRLFDACNVAADPETMLDDGTARRKFEEIVAAQDGDPGVSVDDLEPGAHQATVSADRTGTVAHVDNRATNELARRAGAPRDHGAGVFLHCQAGTGVETGDDLFTVHAETREKLEEARRYIEGTDPVRIRRPGETLVESL